MAEDEQKKFLRDRFLTRRLENKLDKMIGFCYWKTYVATTLYANISTPINLSITIFTALMTAHSSTSSSFISGDMNMKMNLATFLLSILNSYFTPQKEFNELNEYLMKWSNLGNEFEKTIYTSNTYEEKIKSYTTILDNAVSLYKEQYLKKRNFLTDLLHVLVRIIFMGSNDRWMKHETFDFYDKISKVIELDFDLERFKKYKTNSSLLRRLCACFGNCFSCFSCFKKKSTETPSPEETPSNYGFVEPNFETDNKEESTINKVKKKRKHLGTESVILDDFQDDLKTSSIRLPPTPRKGTESNIELTEVKVNN